jgi:hypothetical protein
VRIVSLVGEEPVMRDWAAELVERARIDGFEPTGENGLLTTPVRQVLQTGLEVELTDHLGYEPHAAEGRGSGNSRNGSYPKQVTTEIGKVALRAPRDRNGTFDLRCDAGPGRRRRPAAPQLGRGRMHPPGHRRGFRTQDGLGHQAPGGCRGCEVVVELHR